MIDFWAQIDEADVEKSVKTLTLPAYMSHLEIAPFSLADQASAATGREPLTIVYVGEGRLEELTLEPQEFAPKLLASLSLGLDLEKIRVPTSGAVWTWNEFVPTNPFYARPLESFEIQNDEKNDALEIDCSVRFLRVYFESTTTFETTRTFAPRDAYVSASRREIFLSWRVVESYALERCRDLLKKPTENAPKPDEIASNDRVDFAWNRAFRPFDDDCVDDAATRETFESASQSPTSTSFDCGASVRETPAFRFELDGRQAMFRFGKISGAFAIDSNEFLADAFRFAGLTRSLDYLADYVRYDPSRTTPRLDELGVRVNLTSLDDETAPGPPFYAPDV